MSLSSLNDRELLARLESLCRREQEITLDVLRHLNEVELRKLHLKLGYSSMFVYCTEGLRYSESAAGRRLAAARCIRRVPQVEALLERREVSLMTLGLIERILTPRNAPELIARIRGKSKPEVERIVAEYRPEVLIRDRVRPIRVPAPAAAPATSMTPAPPVHAGSPGALVNAISNSRGGSEKSPSKSATVPMLQLKFAVTPDFMATYREICALLSNKIAKPTFAAVFEALMEDFKKRHSPQERKARREQRNAKVAASRSQRNDRAPSKVAKAAGRAAIPASTRDAVFVRDRGRCTFIGKDGRRCRETHGLHIDHVIPVARNGSNHGTNLRLLCARHNQLEGERVLGEALMQRYTGDKRPARR